MLTTDFSGSYDYEQTEANYAANYLLDDLALGYLTPEDFDFKCVKELIHWKKNLSDNAQFEDFRAHFESFIKAGYQSALNEYIKVSTDA